MLFSRRKGKNVYAFGFPRMNKLSFSGFIASLPSDAIYGPLSVSLFGRSLKNEVNYTAATWAEWTKNIATGDSTGLELTSENGSFAYARINTQLKYSTKYGYLINIVSNNIPNNGAYIDPFNNPQSTNMYLNGTGNIKFVDTTKASSISNRVYVAVRNDLTTGLKIKIRDIRVFELPTGSEIEADFTNLTADQLAAKYNYIKGDGVKSTVPVRAKVAGKNLCPTDVSAWEQGSINTSNGADTSSTLNLRTKSGIYYKIPQGTVSMSQALYLLYAFFYDYGFNFITSSFGTNKTVPTNAVYVRYRVYDPGSGTHVPSEIADIKPQCEVGASSTPWESYTETVAYTDRTLRSVGSVKDKADVTGGVNTKNVSDPYTLQASDVESLQTAATNIDYAVCKLFTNQKVILGGANPVGNFAVTNWSETSVNNIDDVAKIGKFAISGSTGKLVFIVAKGTYANLAAAQAALAGTTLTYQLANPQTSYFDPVLLGSTPGGLIGNNGYTVIIEPVSGTLEDCTAPAVEVSYCIF
jgi:hypothetical protein